jgi:hypothetical protein
MVKALNGGDEVWGTESLLGWFVEDILRWYEEVCKLGGYLDEFCIAHDIFGLVIGERLLKTNWQG